MHRALRVSLVQVFPDSSNVSNCQGARATYVVYMTGRGSVFVKYRAKIAGLVADRYGIITDSNIGHWDNVRVSGMEVDDFCHNLQSQFYAPYNAMRKLN